MPTELIRRRHHRRQRVVAVSQSRKIHEYGAGDMACAIFGRGVAPCIRQMIRSEEHTSELQSLMRNLYSVLCLKKKKNNNKRYNTPKVQNTVYKTKKKRTS